MAMRWNLEGFVFRKGKYSCPGCHTVENEVPPDSLSLLIENYFQNPNVRRHTGCVEFLQPLRFTQLNNDTSLKPFVLCYLIHLFESSNPKAQKQIILLL